MENFANTQKIIEQRKAEKLWENCYLRIKRLLAKEYVKNFSPEIAEQLKILKENYEIGL